MKNSSCLVYSPSSSLISIPSHVTDDQGGLYGLYTQVDTDCNYIDINDKYLLYLHNKTRDSAKIASLCHSAVSDESQFITYVAGTDSNYIKMVKNKTKENKEKYTSIKRRLTSQVAEQHVQGKECLGANLYHSKTTAALFVFDADNEKRWNILQEEASALSAAGAKVWLEESPNRGGHMGITFESPVPIDATFATIFKHAPQLQQLVDRNELELFPTTNRKRVRLPAGYYNRWDHTDPKNDPDGMSYWYQIDDWCQVQCVGADDDGWYTGSAAVQSLMEHLTPVAWITETDLAPPARDDTHYQEAVSFLDRTMVVLADFDEACEATSDPVWLMSYGSTREKLPFWSTTEQTIRWFNSRHRVQDMVRKEENGFVLAFWRQERTASVWLYPATNKWHDYGAGGQRSDGTEDGGDAFELHCHVREITRAQALKKAFKAMAIEAERHLRRGKQTGLVPRWVAEITPPRRRRLPNTGARSVHLSG